MLNKNLSKRIHKSQLHYVRLRKNAYNKYKKQWKRDHRGEFNMAPACLEEFLGNEYVEFYEEYREDFCDDPELMDDFRCLTKKEFLSEHPEITKNQYRNTVKVEQMIFAVTKTPVIYKIHHPKEGK